jgi:hypothetical protein
MPDKIVSNTLPSDETTIILRQSGHGGNSGSTVQAIPFNVGLTAGPYHIQALPANPSMSQVFPLSFEASQESFSNMAESLNRLSLDMVSAVLLYNLALTNLLESRRLVALASAQRRGRHLKFARSLLDVAMKIISFECAEEEAALPLAILLVGGMYQVLIELGDYRSASLAADDFYQLQRTYQQDGMDSDEKTGDVDDEWYLSGSSFTSAAAA